MSFDKAKVIRTAEKFLTQGKILPAIAEYRKIAAHDSSDFTALNMLGDLFVRVDNKQEATACFSRIADHYREQGFNLKAIAMFKKISRLEPLNPDISYQLATLYEAQGLAVDARNQYLVVAEFYTRQNDVRKTLEILHRVADLDPHNVETRLKLAEGYLRETMSEEAAEAFTEAGSQLLSRGNYERAIEAFNRALAFSTANYTAWSGIVSAFTALNAPDEAARALCEAGALESNDIELIILLAQAYIADENVIEAEKVTSVLLRVDPSGYTPTLEVARLYLTTNLLDDCVRVLYTIVDPILNARAEAALIYVLDEALARNPEHLGALHLLVRAYRWQHEEENLQKTLVRIVEVAQTLGLPEEEYKALEQLCNLSLNNDQYRQRLNELSGANNPSTENQQVLMPESEAALYDSLAGLTSGVAHTEEPPVTTEFNLLDVSEPEPEMPVEQFFGETGETLGSFADLSDEAAVAGGSSALDEHHTRALQQELESVEFYIVQGYYDIAQDTLDMLERQFGEQPNIIACKQRLQATQGNPVAAEYPEDAAQSDNESLDHEISFAFTEEVPDSTQDGAIFTDTVSLPDSAPDDTGFYLNEESGELTGFVAENTAEVLLIVDETATPAIFQANPEPQDIAVAFAESEVEPVKPALDPGLTAIFDEFRNAVEEESQMPSDDDYETHYNLGLAYKEMDLTDEAIEEFQIAAKLVKAQDGTQRHLDCCSLLGHCFMLKKLPRVAVMWFQKGLETADLPGEAVLALHYETGLAYEQMGDLDKASETFMQVYGVNVSYRGVNEKLRELQSLQPA